MSLKQLKWGIIGAANIAEQQMIPAILASEDGIVTAIASRSGKANEIQKKFNIPCVTADYDELFSMDQVDAVYIATPNSTHSELIKKAISAGKHVLCEKPIVLKKNDLEEIFQLADHHGVYVMEAMMYRFHPQMKACRNLLQSRAIGDVVTLSLKFHFLLENWDSDIRTSNQLGGGALNDLGCYCLNAANYLLQSEPQSIQALNSIHRQAEVDTHVSLLLHYETGETMMSDSSFHSPMNNEIEIIGTLGTIRMPHAFRPDLNDDIGEIYIEKNDIKEKVTFQANPYVEQVNNFQEAIRTESELSYSREEMIKQVDLLEKAFVQLSR